MELRYKEYYDIKGKEEHNCKLCGFYYSHNRALSTHLQFKHKDYTTQTYYDKFYKIEDEGKCVICGKPTKFFNLMKGYLDCCCKSCSHKTEHFKTSYNASIATRTEEEIKEWRNASKNKIRNNSSTGRCISDKEALKRKQQSIKHLKEIIEKGNCTFIDYEMDSNNIKVAKVKFKCNKCGNEYTRIRAGLDRRNREHNYGLCPICCLKTISKPERELAEYISSIYKGNILRNDRTYLNGNELDIVLPELKIAFEFDGTFWHMDSRLFKATDINPVRNLTAENIWKFDADKILNCDKIGIKLYRIKEYDWNCNQDNIKANISNIVHENLIK